MRSIKPLYIVSMLFLISLFVTALLVNYLSASLDKITISTPTPITKINKIIKTIEVIPTTNPIVNSQVATVTPTPTIINATSGITNKCIITVDDVSYDVTSFKNMHSGGDIFKCGQDMTSDFWGQHGQKQLNAIQKYRI